MLVKASIVAAVLIAAAVPLSRVDYRGTYDEMYPVNGLKRDVLSLCHNTRPTFIRAIRSDRTDCYDSMPDAVDLAIGWVRTSDRLAAMNRVPTPVELAERVLAEAVIRGRLDGPELPRFIGYLAAPAAVRPCRTTALALAAGANPALGESDERLARRLATGGDAALAGLGLGPDRDAAAAQHEDRLPVLPLSGAMPAGFAHDAAPLAGVGSEPPLASASGCRTPA